MLGNSCQNALALKAALIRAEHPAQSTDVLERSTLKSSIAQPVTPSADPPSWPAAAPSAQPPVLSLQEASHLGIRAFAESLARRSRPGVNEK